MTLREIAAEAGVSVSTVSRVINRKGGKPASPETQERIWQIVRRAGYTPNKAARSLKLGRDPEGEALSIACLFARRADSASDLFFSSLARRIEEAALQMGHMVRYTFSPVDIQKKSTLDVLWDDRIAGVIILGRCDGQLFQLLQQRFGDLVYVGLNRPAEEYDQVICDGREAGRMAVEYLADLGHREIGYFGETQNEDRYIGYRTACIQRGLPLEPRHIFNVLVSSEGGYRGAERLIALEHRPSAVFCANDDTAIGVIRRLREHRIRVPEDISVISIDDIETARYISPALTTIHIPIEEMGPAAVKLMIDRIQGGHRLPQKLTLPFRLVERESCRPWRR